MKTKNMPNEAWGAQATEIPQKLTPDWAALFDILEQKGWIVLEPPPEDLRETTNGAYESKLFKDFRNYAMNNKRLMLNAKRIGLNRWFVVVGNPVKARER